MLVAVRITNMVYEFLVCPYVTSRLIIPNSTKESEKKKGASDFSVGGVIKT
jgi:hypothetical protein